MLILAIDTSGLSGSVALLDEHSVLAEIALDTQRRSAQTLVPAMVELLAMHRIEPAEIRLIATTVGPGSFTGLRVGVTAAKTFAYAVGADVLGISTLEAVVHGVPEEMLSVPGREVHAVLDAQRKELFVGRFRSYPGDAPVDGLPRLTRLQEDRIVPVAAWLESLPADAIVSGAGLQRLESELPGGVDAVPPARREVKAGVVGRLAWRACGAGRRDDLWKLAPVYLRPSYAEEKASKSDPPLS